MYVYMHILLVVYTYTICMYMYVGYNFGCSGCPGLHRCRSASTATASWPSCW